MAIAQAFFVSSPLSAFANLRHSCSSAESTLRSIHNYVGTWRSHEARNVGFLPDLRRSECRSSKSSNFVSFYSPEVGLICLTKQSGITSNSPFPFCIRSRESRNYLSKNHDSGIRKPVVRRAAVTTKQEESVVTVEEGGGGGGMGGPNDGGGGGGGGGGDAVDWISSALIFAFWAGLIFYAITLSPNQTSYRDMYFLEKLCNLHGDDGFVMNQVLTGEWFMMGLWPLVYTCLLIPSGRSRKGGVPVGPFAALSCFIGAGALLPYFGLWRPPPPAVSRDELSRWPLSVLESKITAVVTVVTAVVLLGYAGLAGADQWVEFIQYFRESRFIHIMTIDFFTLSTLCPFWVYNDLSIRKGSDKTSSLWALAFLPLFGPSIYLLLRPSLPASMIVESEKKNDEVSS